MPRKQACAKPGTRKYGTKSRYTENDLRLAIERVKKCEISQGEAAKIYNIPRSTLKYKLKNKHKKNVGRPQVLSDAEEQIIASHIIVLSDLGLPLGMQDIRVIVKRYLDDSKRNEPQFTNNLPGWEWGNLFLKRHPVIKQKVAHQISRKRAQVNQEMIEEYFVNLNASLADIPPENIFNFDESGFHDNPKKSKLLFRRNCRNPEVIKNSTKSCFTVMFCASATGEFVPPFIIYKAKQKWSHWIIGAPPGTRMAVTKSGWIDAETFDEWFEKQLLPILKKKKGKKAVIGDNLSSHLTLKSLQLCKDNDIKFICLLPNSTHLLQPLDVAYFSSLKLNWRKVLGDWRQTRRGKVVVALPKNVFAPLLRKALEMGQETSSQNIVAGFKACGIYPINSEVVIKKLPKYGKPIEEIREEVGESFKKYMDEVRNVDLGIQTNRKKFQIPVTAAKTVSVEEVEQFYTEKEKKKDSATKRKGRPTGSKNKGNKKKILAEKKTSRASKTAESLETVIEFDSERHLDETRETTPIIRQTASRSSTPDVSNEAVFVMTTAAVHESPSLKSLDKSIQQKSTDRPIIAIENSLQKPIEYMEVDSDHPYSQHNLDLNYFVPDADNEVLIEEFVEENDGALKIPDDGWNKRIEQQAENKSGYCIITYEDTLFPGRIIDFDGQKFKISVMQKDLEGWKWPPRADIFCCLPKDIVKHLSNDKVTKKSNYFTIEDDFLNMEWGD